jgi:hypothetical protein
VESEEPNFLETLNRDLALALGEAVWAFARLEWLTCKWIGYLTAIGVDELVVDLGYDVRAKMLKRVLRRNTDPEKQEQVEAIAKLLNDGKKLAERRNIIVHNPWSVWIDFEAREFRTEIQKYADKENKVNLDELRKFTRECGELESELKEALRAFEQS